MNRSTSILPVFVLTVFLIGIGNAVPLEEYGDRIYEPELQLNFPRDANLAHSLGFEQTYGSNGFMVYNDALRFIRFLNHQAYLGACRTWRRNQSHQGHPVKAHALFPGHEENLRLFSNDKSSPINFSSPQGMHAFQIPSDTNQTPFTLDRV